MWHVIEENVDYSDSCVDFDGWSGAITIHASALDASPYNYACFLHEVGHVMRYIAGEFKPHIMCAKSTLFREEVLAWHWAYWLAPKHLRCYVLAVAYELPNVGLPSYTTGWHLELPPHAELHAWIITGERPS